MAALITTPFEPVTLESQTSVTSTGNGSAIQLWDTPYRPEALCLALLVTAAATDGTDAIDVFFQAYDGANYVDVAHFTQVLGTVSTEEYYMKMAMGASVSTFTGGASLAAGAVREMPTATGRFRWAITSGNSPSFSFNAVGWIV